MSGRSTFILLVLVLLTGGFIWFFERGGETTDDQMARARFALRIQPDQITRLRLDSSKIRMQFSKQGDGWHITAPIQTMADESHIDELLTRLAILPSCQIITGTQLRRRHQGPADYGLDPPRWKIALGDRDSELVLLVGNDAPTGDALYLQVSGTHNIIVSPTNIISSLPAGVADFRDRRLMTGLPDDVARLDLRSRFGFVQAACDANGVWHLSKPVAARANFAAVDAALRELFAAQIVDFEASSKVGSSLYGFDEPALQCSVLSRDGTVEQTLLLGKPVEGRTNLVYATKQGDEEVYTVDRNLAARLTLPADELRDRRLMPLPPDAITSIRVDSDDHPLVLERTNGAWLITSPRIAPADGEKIQLALAEWSGARIKAFADQPGTNLAALGLAPPLARISFTAVAGGGSPAAAKIIYEVSSALATGATRIVRIAGEESLLTIDASALAALPAQPLYFRDPVVLSVDTGTVNRLAFESATATNIVQLDTSNAPPAAAAAALKLLRSLRARALITEDTRDLSAYGLQPPEATLTIGLKTAGSPSRIITLGKRAPGGGRFAAIQGQDLIFTLDEKDAGALAEIPPAAGAGKN